MKYSIKDRFILFIVGVMSFSGIPFIPYFWTRMSEANNSSFADIFMALMVLSVLFAVAGVFGIYSGLTGRK